MCIQNTKELSLLSRIKTTTNKHIKNDQMNLPVTSQKIYNMAINLWKDTQHH